MMASIFFMACFSVEWAFLPVLPYSTLCLQEVTFLAVLAHVQALDLVIGHHPHSGYRIADLQNNERSHDGQAPRNRAADRLVQHLPGVAIHPSERHHSAGGVLQTVVDGAG